MAEKTSKYNAEVQWIERAEHLRTTEVTPLLNSPLEACSLLLVQGSEVRNSCLPLLLL